MAKQPELPFPGGLPARSAKPAPQLPAMRAPYPPPRIPHTSHTRIPLTPDAESPRLAGGRHQRPVPSGAGGYTERMESWVPTERVTTYQGGVDEQSVQHIADAPDAHMNHLPPAEANTYIAGDGRESYEVYDGNHRVNARMLKGQLIQPMIRDVAKEGPTTGPTRDIDAPHTMLHKDYLPAQEQAVPNRSMNPRIPTFHRSAGDPAKELKPMRYTPPTN